MIFASKIFSTKYTVLRWGRLYLELAAFRDSSVPFSTWLTLEYLLETWLTYLCIMNSDLGRMSPQWTERVLS